MHGTRDWLQGMKEGEGGDCERGHQTPSQNYSIRSKTIYRTFAGMWIGATWQGASWPPRPCSSVMLRS